MFNAISYSLCISFSAGGEVIAFKELESVSVGVEIVQFGQPDCMLYSGAEYHYTNRRWIP